MKEMYKILKECSKFKFLFLSLLICKLLFSIVSLASSEVLRMSTSAIEQRNIDILITVILFAAVSAIAYIVLEFVVSIFSTKLTNKCEMLIQQLLLNKIFKLKKLKFMKYNTGEMVTKIIENVENTIRGIMDTIFLTLEGIFIIVFGILYMGSLSMELMIIMVAFNIVFRITTMHFDKKIKQSSKQSIEVKNRNNSFLIDVLNNTIIIKVFNKYTYFQNMFFQREKETMQSEIRVFSWYNTYNELVWMTKKMAELIVLYGYGGWLVYQGRLRFSVIIAFTFAIDYFAHGIIALIDGISRKNITIPNIKFILDFLEEDGTEEEEMCPIEEESFVIRFENVSFSFQDQEVLKDVNFTIYPGEKVKITGPNGHGKSTLLNLILGFYRPDGGEIFYGKQNINFINIDDLNQKYRYISQNSSILPGNVYENIMLQDEVDQGICDQILDKLNLLQIKHNHPKNLSQGEKQRLNIGRALYKSEETPCIIGDEIFANIDKENKDLISDMLSSELQNKTVILVVHDDMNFKFQKNIYVNNKTIQVAEMEC